MILVQTVDLLEVGALTEVATAWVQVQAILVTATETPVEASTDQSKDKITKKNFIVEVATVTATNFKEVEDRIAQLAETINTSKERGISVEVAHLISPIVRMQAPLIEVRI